jgi:hypothetical protein
MWLGLEKLCRKNRENKTLAVNEAKDHVQVVEKNMLVDTSLKNVVNAAMI